MGSMWLPLPKLRSSITPLFPSLWDWGPGMVCPSVPFLVKGVDLNEWGSLVLADYDEVDRLYIDHETIGG